MSTSKHWAFGVPYDLNSQRPPLFQLLGALLLKLGFSEYALQFLLVLVPSTLLILFIYLLAKEMFNEKIGIISSIGTGLIWSYLFWSTRFQPDFLSLDFQILGLLFFWKLLKNNNYRYAILTGLFSALGFYFKITALLIPLFMAIYAFYKDGFSLFKNKFYWTAALSFVISFIPFMMWQYYAFGSPLAFAPSYASSNAREGRELGWMTLSYYYIFPKILFFALFAIGALYFIFKFVLTLDIQIKERKNRLNPELFAAIILIITAAYFIFFTKGTIEDRWVFIIAPFIMIFSAQGTVLIEKFLKKFNKNISILIIIIFIGFLTYYQVQHAGALIEAKKTTYEPVKEASLYIKENSNPDESVLSVSYTQTTTYSERRVYTYAKMDKENFTKLLEEKKPSYIMVSILEPHHPNWIINQGYSQDGKWMLNMEYFNSSMVAYNNQVLSYDIKASIDKGPYKFDVVYPTSNQFSGLFVYKITYKS